jgi:hypothetical protein
MLNDPTEQIFDNQSPVCIRSTYFPIENRAVHRRVDFIIKTVSFMGKSIQFVRQIPAVLVVVICRVEFTRHEKYSLPSGGNAAFS